MLLALLLAVCDFEVFPTGNGNLDTDAIQSAVDAAPEGSTICLRSVNRAGATTPFVLAKLSCIDDPRGHTACASDTPCKQGKCVAGICVANGCDSSHPDPDRYIRLYVPASVSEERNLHGELYLPGDTVRDPDDPLHNQAIVKVVAGFGGRKPISVTKSLQFVGDDADVPVIIEQDGRRVAGNKPKTQITTKNGNAMFVVHNGAEVTFRGMLFSKFGNRPIMAHSIVHVDNCWTEDSSNTTFPIVDLRTVYPPDGVRLPDGSNTRRSSFTDSVFKNTRVLEHIWTPGFDIRNNLVVDLKDIGDIHTIIPIAIHAADPPAVFSGLAGYPAEFRNAWMLGGGDAVVEGNVLDNSNGATHGPWVSIHALNGTTIRDVVVRDNIFIDTEAMATLSTVDGPPFALGGGTIEGIRILSNTMEGAPAPAVIVDIWSRAGSSAPSTIRDVLLADNTFRNVYNSAHPAPLVLVHGEGTGNTLSKIDLWQNHYQESGYPGNHGDPGMTWMIVLSGASSSKVFESGQFPEGQGGARFFVSDDLGSNNRIVGAPASTSAKPAGIGGGAGR